MVSSAAALRCTALLSTQAALLSASARPAALCAVITSIKPYRRQSSYTRSNASIKIPVIKSWNEKICYGRQKNSIQSSSCSIPRHFASTTAPSTPSSSTTPPSAAVSTTSRLSPSPSASTAIYIPPSSSQSQSPQTLTWNRFLALRRTRRHFNLFSSISTSLVTTSAGMAILTQQDIDKLGTQIFGLDPIAVLGLATLACGGVGWLLGPFWGGAVFRWWYRGVGGEMAAKERAFYQRIKRYRADPSTQSLSNPVPDYYGEKIGSVQAYRQWLKDQRAFMKRRGGA
ncbi:MAG: TIM23 complex component [Icmadophila ericetorum]|nr:TIM23 complex component [Icmadophila ericetorum]